MGRDVIPNSLDDLIEKVCAAMDIADDVQTRILRIDSEICMQT